MTINKTTSAKELPLNVSYPQDQTINKQSLDKKIEQQNSTAATPPLNSKTSAQNQRLQPTKNHFSYKNVRMPIFYGFMTVAGSLAVALSFILLSAAAANPVGIIVAITGVGLALAGVGLFANHLYKNHQKNQESPVLSTTRYS